MDAVDITPLLRTKDNWPKYWRGVIAGDNGEYFTLYVFRDDTKLATIRLFHQNRGVEMRLARHGSEEGTYTACGNFDMAIEWLEEMV